EQLLSGGVFEKDEDGDLVAERGRGSGHGAPRLGRPRRGTMQFWVRRHSTELPLGPEAAWARGIRQKRARERIGACHSKENSHLRIHPYVFIPIRRSEQRRRACGFRN